VTESQWLACTDPTPMLEFLRGKASDRKLRLFAVACCHSVWPLLSHKRMRKVVKLSELLADGLATEEEHQEASDAAARVASGSPPNELSGDKLALWYLAWSVVEANQCGSGKASPNVVGQAAAAVSEAAALVEVAYHPCDLLRDIFGSLPFRPVRLAPAVLAWNGGIARCLAQAIYEERAFERTPILADALEEAGCTEAAVLNHLRGPGPHVRGCHILDLVLGRE
jgi:hypothetical protein